MPNQLAFLHGFMGEASDWDEVRAQLSEFETRAINIEVATDWQDTLHSIANSLTSNSIVIGYSMGARLALGIALEFPKKCGGLIFISGNPGLESDEERDARKIADEKVASRIEQFGVKPATKKSFLNDWYRSSVFTSLPDEIRKQEIQRKLGRDANDWPAMLRVNSVSRQPNYWPRLNELSMPTLVVAGERDEKYKAITFRFAEAVVSNRVTSRVLENCGHMVHREKSAELSHLIRNFIKQHSR